MGEPDGSSRAPLGDFPWPPPPPPPPFAALSPSAARQINSLRFSAFQLPLPPLPDHVVYLCREGRRVRDVLAGPLVGLSTRARGRQRGTTSRCLHATRYLVPAARERARRLGDYARAHFCWRGSPLILPRLTELSFYMFRNYSRSWRETAGILSPME